MIDVLSVIIAFLALLCVSAGGIIVVYVVVKVDIKGLQKDSLTAATDILKNDTAFKEFVSKHVENEIVASRLFFQEVKEINQSISMIKEKIAGRN